MTYGAAQPSYSSSLVVAFFTRLLCSTSMPVVALELDCNATKVSRETCVTGSGVAHSSRSHSAFLPTANPRPFIRDANNCVAVEKMVVQGSMNEIGVSRRDRWQRSKGSQVSDVERRVVFTCRV